MITRVTQRLGMIYPVFSAGMARVSQAALVAAVSEAGGMGCLGGVSYMPDALGEEIRAIRARTRRPFAVNLLTSGLGDALTEEIDRSLQPARLAARHPLTRLATAVTILLRDLAHSPARARLVARAAAALPDVVNAMQAHLRQDLADIQAAKLLLVPSVEFAARIITAISRQAAQKPCPTAQGPPQSRHGIWVLPAAWRTPERPSGRPHEVQVAGRGLPHRLDRGLGQAVHPGAVGVQAFRHMVGIDARDVERHRPHELLLGPPGDRLGGTGRLVRHAMGPAAAVLQPSLSEFEEPPHPAVNRGPAHPQPLVLFGATVPQIPCWHGPPQSPPQMPDIRLQALYPTVPNRSVSCTCGGVHT